jgi:hypothetical protein
MIEHSVDPSNVIGPQRGRGRRDHGARSAARSMVRIGMEVVAHSAVG